MLLPNSVILNQGFSAVLGLPSSWAVSLDHVSCLRSIVVQWLAPDSMRGKGLSGPPGMTRVRMPT
jgi:hypothetical protein